MALPGSGALSLNDIQGEFGGSNPIGINEYYRGGGLVPDITANNTIPTSGTIAIDDFYSTTNTPTYDIVTSTNTTNVNFRTLLDAAGFDNSVASIITYTLNSGITVGGTATGTPAWQSGTLASNHTVTITIGGSVLGKEGAGGAQTSSGWSACYKNNGATGGDAMSFAASGPTYTVTVSSGADVRSGGGGGGSGGSDWGEFDKEPRQDAFGGRGGDGQGYGRTGGAESGSGGENNNPAQGGTGGAGGAYGAAGSSGGNGSDSGCTGGSGGSAGYAIRKNGTTVNVTNNGTISGTQG